jgi:hypothetical protein
MSNLVEEKDLDEFFQASSLNEQKELFKKISSGLKDMILLVKCTSIMQLTYMIMQDMLNEGACAISCSWMG